VGLLVLVAGGHIGGVVAIAHEGGHTMIGILTGGSVKDFQLSANEESGGTNYNRRTGCSATSRRSWLVLTTDDSHACMCVPRTLSRPPTSPFLASRRREYGRRRGGCR
jgi:Peptidase M50B-like